VATDKDRAAPETRRALQRAIELNPQCARAYLYLGQVLKQMGDADRAYIEFQRVLQLQPDNVDAQREVRLMDMRRQKGGKSILDRLRKK